MMTREITLTAEYSVAETTAEKKTITIPVSALRTIVRGKKVISYLGRHIVALAALAGCIALNLHWGVNGTLFLALPYAMIWDHLDNDK